MLKTTTNTTRKQLNLSLYTASRHGTLTAPQTLRFYSASSKISVDHWCLTLHIREISSVHVRLHQESQQCYCGKKQCPIHYFILGTFTPMTFKISTYLRFSVSKQCTSLYAPARTPGTTDIDNKQEINAPKYT